MSAQLTDIHKSFGALKALDGVSLQIADGEFVAVLGPSGCGKTTLLRIVAGFEAPTSGQVHIGSELVGSATRSVPTERRDLGMVFQSFALWPHMSVADHVRFPLTYQRKGARRADRDGRVREVLEMTGLGSMADRMPHQLSGGQRQRVALARAVASSPALLLMDEPLSALDAALREEMRREIQNLHRRTNASVVYVTHDQGEALAMADRIVVMRDGRIEQAGSPWEIYHRPQTEFVATFVGKANLVAGSWEHGDFVPSAGGGRVRWAGFEVAGSLRDAGWCPVRPEQLRPRLLAEGESPGAGEITGLVSNALFQGRDVHYVIDVDDSTWQVYGDASARPGDRVAISARPQDVAAGSGE